MARKNKADKLELELRDNKICNLHLMGQTSASIAKELEISESQVNRVIKKDRDSWLEKNTEVRVIAKNEDLARLDALIQDAMTQYFSNKDHKLLNSINTLMERKARLLGNDSPNKQAQTTPDGEKEAESGVFITFGSNTGEDK